MEENNAPLREFKPPSSPDRLRPGEGFGLEQCLKSPNGKVRLVMEGYGFALVNEVEMLGALKWVPGGMNNVMMDIDGNVTAQAQNGDIVWSTNTKMQGDEAEFILNDEDDNGYFVVVTGGSIVWSSKTDTASTWLWG